MSVNWWSNVFNNLLTVPFYSGESSLLHINESQTFLFYIIIFCVCCASDVEFICILNLASMGLKFLLCV